MEQGGVWVLERYKMRVLKHTIQFIYFLKHYYIIITLTNDNPLTDLHSRQRAPLKQLSRCFDDHTRNEPSTSGTPDEEVDYRSCGSSVNPSTDSDHKWSTFENDSQY